MDEFKYQIQYRDTTPGGSDTWVNREGATFPYIQLDGESMYVARQKALDEIGYLRKRFVGLGDFRLVIISTEVLEWA